MREAGKIEALQEIFEKYREEKGFSGAALIKGHDEVLFSFCSGYENRMYKIENKLRTAFDTASITKLFTAAGIVLLRSRGQIGYEDNIHSILDLKKTKIPKDVKIRHLLTHTSGIADDAEEEKGEDYSALFIDSPNYALRDNKDFLKNFAYKEPNFKAGEKIYYNNCAFILLGMAIEKITGRSYRSFITEEIFEPLQLKNTFFAAKEECDRPCAEGYFYDEDGKLKKNIYSFPPIGTADSGAYTTVEDLDIFLRTVSTSPIYGEMMRPQAGIKEKKEDHYYTVGFGFEIIEKDGEIIKVFKEGQNDGVCNISFYYPKEELSLSILGNVDCNVWRLASSCEKILDIL